MSHLHVNLLPPDHSEHQPHHQHQPHTTHQRPPHRPRRLTYLAAIFGLVLLVSALVTWSTLSFSGSNVLGSLSQFQLLGQIGRLIVNQDRQLQGEADGRINVVLIGIGGEKHEGGTLADTIIVGSLKASTSQAAVMSIPRDLSVETTNRGWIKINAVYAYAEKDRKGSGGEALMTILSKVTGTTIPYYITVDFDGFEKLIDEFGGVDIDVERDLIDPQYPIRGREDAEPYETRFETLRIAKGRQHFDGKTALKYARSRHALGAEGSDFARSRRQQKILAAVKEKVVSLDTLSNPRRLSSLFAAYRNNVWTNMDMWELLRLAQMGQHVDMSNVASYPLTDGADSLLYADNINGAYVLLPRGGTYDKIHTVWQNIFALDTLKLGNGTASSSKPAAFAATAIPNTAPTTTTTSTATSTNTITSTSTVTTATSTVEKATVEILNGTNIAGWASVEKLTLIDQGLTVTAIGNAPTRDYTAIVVYDISVGKYPQTAKKLSKLYDVPIISGPPVGVTSTANFVVILGK